MIYSKTDIIYNNIVYNDVNNLILWYNLVYSEYVHTVKREMQGHKMVKHEIKLHTVKRIVKRIV